MIEEKKIGNFNDIIREEKEKILIAIAFDEFEKNMPKSKEASALGMHKMYKALVPAVKLIIHYYEVERVILDKYE